MVSTSASLTNSLYVTGTPNLVIDRATVTFNSQTYYRIGNIVYVAGSVTFATTTTSQETVYFNYTSYPFTPLYPTLQGTWVVGNGINGQIGVVNNNNGWFLPNVDGSAATAVTLSGRTVRFCFSYITTD